jgi:hypothetical protein
MNPPSLKKKEKQLLIPHKFETEKYFVQFNAFEDQIKGNLIV